MRFRRGRQIQAMATSVECLGLALSGTGASTRRYLAVLPALALVALVVLTTSVAFGAISTEYVKSFGPESTTGSDFERINSVAVDQQTGFVYVLDGEAGALYKFEADGQPLAWGGTAPYISGNEINGLDPFTGRNEAQVAVDSTSHVVYVTEKHAIRAFQEDGEAAEFTAGPGAGTSEIPGISQLVGVAVDLNGDVYASDHAGTVTVFAASGEPITSFASPGPGNLAVASDGAVYVAKELQEVQKFAPDEFPVTATSTYTAGPTLGGGSGVASVGVGVDPQTNDLYILETDFGSSWVEKYDSSSTFLRSFARPGEEGELAGFGQGIAVVGDGEEFQFYVGNAEESAGTSKVEIFGERITPGPPNIESISVADVTSNSATLYAGINPNTFATSYRFEYGLGDCSASASACASAPMAGAAIGDGHRIVAVSQDITGLQSGATYHYRVVAGNSQGDTASIPDHTFATQSAGLGFELSDSRAWEMVSPPDKHGALLDGSLNAHVQAADDGDALTLPSRGSIEAEPEGSRAVEAATVLADRTADGWRSKDIALPNQQVTDIGLGIKGEYKLFSSDLAQALVEPRTDIPLSPDASERTLYLRGNTEPPSYTPLVTDANVPPGTEFGGDPTLNLGAVAFVGASADLSHLVLSSEVALLEGAPPAPGRSLYLWTAGQLQPVSVLPPAEGGAMVAAQLIGSGGGSVRHAISEVGSRVFWTDDPTALYLRDSEDEETVRLDLVQPPASGLGVPSPIFQGANAQGTVAFFTDSQQLTEDASPSGRDLYRCEIPAGSPVTGCRSLVDITAPIAGSGESAEMQGLAPGVSDDGSTIYFVARGVLDGAANQAGETAASGEPNLYVWQQGAGVRFIVSLSEEDENDWGSVSGRTEKLSAAASPGGRYLSFMSQRSLTGKNNLDAESGEPVEQVFRYDASTDRLDCVSCNPTGAPPHSELTEGGDFRRLVDPRKQWQKKRVAAILPEPPIADEGNGVSLYSPRRVLDNGRVFFNAIDSLVPADSNGEWDVYQYEPTGAGDCTESSGDAATSRTAGGCVSLMSSGTGEKEAGFLDASETGDDVFFLTPAKLNVPDDDDELDVYDARVNGIPSILPPRTECLGEACQPFTGPPSDPTPGSASYKGAGNVREHCPKGKRKVHRKGKTICVRKPHKHKRHHKRAGQSGRGQR
jgi:hypothetical protein